MRVKFIPVNNNLDKAIAFANTLDPNNIRNVQKIQTPQHYIETLDVVKMLQNEGWELSGVDEYRNKQRKVVSHFLQLHHNDFQIITNGKRDAVASITLSNSCNGKKPLEMSLGAYRLVCSNGLMVGEEFATERFKHIQVDYNNLVNKINLFGNKIDKVLNKFNELKQHTLDNDLVRKFTTEAASLRFAPEEVNSRVAELLRVSRLEDEGNNLWAVYNRVQENLTHDVKNPNIDIKLNQQLFSLVENYM
jgi:hypothetical protein